MDNEAIELIKNLKLIGYGRCHKCGEILSYRKEQELAYKVGYTKALKEMINKLNELLNKIENG